MRNNFWVNKQRKMRERERGKVYNEKITTGKIKIMTGKSVEIRAEIYSAIISTVETQDFVFANNIARSMYRTYWIQRLPLPSNFPLLTRRELFDFLDELRDIWLWLGLLSVLFFSSTSWQLYDVWVTVNIGCTLPESSMWLRETQEKQTTWSIGFASWFCFYMRNAASWKIHWLNIHYPIVRTNVPGGYISCLPRNTSVYTGRLRSPPRLISNKNIKL